MAVRVTECPEDDCNAQVVICDNGVRLSYPAEPFDRDTPDGPGWGIAKLGPTVEVATFGGEPPVNGMGHRLHEHQPPSHDSG